MSFFNFTPGTDSRHESWTVSGQMWIYQLITIPLTAVTVGGVVLWAEVAQWEDGDGG